MIEFSKIVEFCRKNTQTIGQYTMEKDKRRRIDELCFIIRRCIENDLDFYLSTENPLSIALAVLYSYYGGFFPFDRVVRVKRERRITIEEKRVLHFGEYGDIPSEYTKMTIENYILHCNVST
ncbi:hypothetical protein PAEPH01_1443 [Pancytospora epiphaga]|nr:hypothetical protein PAEPH01_1443 [Pancytospora epiphaga]